MEDKVSNDKHLGGKSGWASCPKEDLRYLRHQIWEEAPKGTEELRKCYDDYAVHYKQASLNYGNVAPSNLADVVSDVILDKTARILDAASGVGMVGEELRKHRFVYLDALDISQASLDQSKTLGVYTNYICDTLDEHRTQIQDDFYDVVVMCGAMGVPGHVTESCLPELIRITKPGGFLIFTVSGKTLALWQDKLDTAIEELTKKGMWELVETRWIEYIKGEDYDKAIVPILQVK